MRHNVICAIYCVLLAFLAGCSSLAPLLASRTPTPAPALKATSTPQPIPTSTAPVIDSARLLRLWLPPQFDPNAGTPSADLLKQRLQDFETEHQGIRIEVRIKDEATILNALSVTNNAAPAIMPDLIALSYSDMQTAASAGYLHPLEGLTSLLQDPDWYAVARDLGHVQNTEFGLPFASDVLLTVYRPSVFEIPPANWDTVIELGSPIVFPISDPHSLFLVSLYLSDGGKLIGDQGRITLDESALTRVLSFQQNAISTGTIPFASRDFQTDAQSLQYFREGSADLAVVWLSNDIQSKSGAYAPLMGLDGALYSLADGWVWSLAGSNVDNQALAVELASYLVDSAFLSAWTQQLGYAPTRPQALNGWNDAELRDSVNEALQAAHPIPTDDVLSVVSPLFKEAIMRIVNGEQFEVVVRSVMERVK